jgi:hypothetical protein
MPCACARVASLGLVLPGTAAWRALGHRRRAPPLAPPPRRGKNDRTITSKLLDDFQASLQQQQRGKESKIRSAGPKMWSSSTSWDE